LIWELERCGRLNIPYLVTHLGSHLGRGERFGLNRVVEACRRALSNVQNDVMLILENTAGTKNSVGHTFENIRLILDSLDSKDRVGVCFDTAHAFAAGYDLRSKEDVDRSIGLLDDIIGMDRVKVVHLNDSKGAFQSHLDRHEHIGLGYIGEEGFRAILKHRLFMKIPLILETPVDSRRGDIGNLMKVRELAE